MWAILLLLIGWSAWQFSKPEHAPQPLLKALDIKQIHAITLTPVHSTTIRLEKQQDKWMLSGKPVVPVKSEAVQRLLHDLAAMHIIRVVTHTHAHDSELGMNKATKLVLSDNSGIRLLDLTIGKQGSDLISTYVRIGQKPEVFAVDKALIWQVRRNINAWKEPSSKPVHAHKQIK